MAKTKTHKPNTNQSQSWIVGVLDDYFGADLRTLALIRILAGMAVLFILAMLYGDIEPFFTDSGVYPRDYWLEKRTNPYIVSFHMIRGELWWQYLLIGIHAIFAFMMLIGYKTRVASLMTWILLISLFSRTPTILNAGDTVLGLMVLWGTLTPWGARFSVDAALNSLDNIPTRAVSFATAGFVLQMPIVYFFTTILKWEDPSWHEEFSAVFYSLSPEFVTSFGRIVAEHQPYVITQALTIITIALEGIAPILMFFPLLIFARRDVRQRWLGRFRVFGIVAFTTLQIGLVLTLALGAFPFVSTLAILAVLPSTSWAWLAQNKRVVAASQLTIYYDPECRFCKKIVLIIREFLLPQSAILKPATADDIANVMKSANSWVVKDAQGQLFFAYDAFLIVIKHSPWAFLLYRPLRLFYIPGQLTYRIVARNRSFFSRFTETLEYRRYAIRTGIIFNVIAALLLANILVSNVDSITDDRILPRQLRQIEIGMRIHQNWRMFVIPFTWSSYYVIHAVLRNGDEVDLFGGGGKILPDGMSAKELTWDKPEKQQHSAIHNSARWRKYLQQIRRTKNKNDRLHYGRYICRTWNSQHPKDQEVMTFKWYRMVQTKNLRDIPFYENSQKRLLWRHRCFKGAKFPEEKKKQRISKKKN